MLHITITVVATVCLRNTAGNSALWAPSERANCAAVCTPGFVCKCRSDMRTHNDTFTMCGTKCHRWRTVININTFWAALCNSEIHHQFQYWNPSIANSSVTEGIVISRLQSEGLSQTILCGMNQIRSVTPAHAHTALFALNYTYFLIYHPAPVFLEAYCTFLPQANMKS